jgi:hypothetical protein
MKTKLTPFAVLFFSLTILSPLYAGAPDQGEPVPGAEIYVELEPDDEPISATNTEDGEFTFEGLTPGNYQVIVKLPDKSIESFTSKEAIKNPNIKQSGYYHKKGQYFLSKNRGLFLIELKDFKKINENGIMVSSKTIIGKGNKNSVAILQFQVTGKKGKIVISLGSVKPKNYNSEIINARTTGPFSQALSNIEDNG